MLLMKLFVVCDILFICGGEDFKDLVFFVGIVNIV